MVATLPVDAFVMASGAFQFGTWAGAGRRRVGSVGDRVIVLLN